MRPAVVTMLLGAISMCLGCVATGETEAEPEEATGVDLSRCILVGPPPTGIVADVAEPKGMRLVLPAIEVSR